MTLPSPDTTITDISPSLISELTFILNENNLWKSVAREFNRRFGIFQNSDIISIQRHPETSWRFLQYLAKHGCTVGLLCFVLRNMQLYGALSILVDPEPVQIIQQPGDDNETKHIFKGRELKLECRAIGIPPPNYIWYHGNEELEEQTTSILTINEFGEQCEGEYYCCAYQEIDGRVLRANSNIINVEIHPCPPVITQHPEAQRVCRIGESLTLVCEASGHPEPQYKWFKGNQQITGEESNVLNIPQVKASDAGFYLCYVQNRAGEVWSSKCKLSVVSEEDVFPGLEGPVRLKAKGKVALLIGNDTYCHLNHLITPRKDVATIAEILEKMDFKVIALHNLTLQEMRSAVEIFCSLLSEGSYAFFHYAGHGFEIQGKFMLPIDAPGPEEYLRRDSLCEQEVIQAINQRKPKLIFMLLDMCLIIPDKKENPGIHNEIAETYFFEPLRNQIIQYTTTSNLSAYEEVKGENSIYISHLKEHLAKDLPIRQILDLVKKASAGDRQIPLYSSNVVDEFYLTDSVEENEKMKKRFQKFRTLPQLGPSVQFAKEMVEADVRVVPHRNCFLNSLDVIVSGLGFWNVGIQLQVPLEPAGSNVSNTVDPRGKCLLQHQELKKSLGLDIKKLPNNDLVIIIHNLQRVKIPLHLSLFLKKPATDTLVDSVLLDLGCPLIYHARMWYNPKDKCGGEPQSGK